MRSRSLGLSKELEMERKQRASLQQQVGSAGVGKWATELHQALRPTAVLPTSASPQRKKDCSPHKATEEGKLQGT